MLIGQPKTIDEFPALTAEQAAYLAQPIMQALHAGHPLDVPVQIDFGVVCQLLATVKHFGMEIERLTALLPKDPEAPVEETPVEPPFPTIIRPFPTQE
jgi:hypothetical protein